LCCLGATFVTASLADSSVVVFIAIVAGGHPPTRSTGDVMAKSTTPRPPSTRKPRAVKAPVSTAKIVSIMPPPDPAMVAVRAYEIFLQNGSMHGCDIEHWLQAERELLNARLTSAA
jgi:Protein of unknown function (DUF2934)